MKNRKGFTLIELLAVVVILALVALISIPAVNRYILNSRDKGYAFAEQSMVSSTRNLLTECEGYVYGEDNLTYCSGFPVPQEENKTTTVSLQELVTYGYLKPIEDPGKKGEYCDTSRSYVIVRNTGGDGLNINLDFKVVLFCPSKNYEDDITENVDSDFIVLVSSVVQKSDGTEENYEYGTWVKDNIKVTLSTTYSGTVSEFQYKKVSDATWTTMSGTTLTLSESTKELYQFRGVNAEGEVSGNWAETKSYKIDKDAPTGDIKLVGDKNIDVEDIPFISSVDVSCGNVADNYSGIRSCGVSLTPGSGYVQKLTIEGENLHHTVYLRAEDNMGNVLEKEKSFGIDKTSPVLGSVTAVLANGSTYTPGSWTNQTVKLLGNATDNLQLDKIVYTVGTEPTEVNVGQYFEISTTKNTTVSVKAQDTAKNKSTELTVNVKIDKDKPIIDRVDGLDAAYGTSQTITVIAHDEGGSNLPAEPYSFDNGSTWQAASSKTYTSNQVVNIKVRDVAGNISNVTTVSVGMVDREGPVISSITGNPTDWVRSATITVNATDEKSGLHAQAYSYDNGATWTSYNTATFSSNQTITVKVRDALYNVSSQTVTFTKLDSVAPTVSLSGNTSSYSTKKTLVITATDNLSGLHATPYSFDNGSTWQASNSKEFTDNTTVNVKVKDKLGNTSPTVSTTIETVDRTGPTFSVTGNTSTVTQTKTLTITNASDAMSGLHATPYSFDNGSTWTTSASKEFSANGEVKIVVRDTLGNKTTKTITISKIDHSGPTVTVTGNPTSWTTSATLSITAEDVGLAGMHSTPYSFDGGSTWTATASKTYTSNTTVSIRVRDKVGNYTDKSVSITKVDGTTPTVSITAKKSSAGSAVGSNNWSNEGLNFTLTKGTTGSSGYTIYYCKDTNNTCSPSTTATSGTAITSYNTLTGTFYIRYKITSGSGVSSSVASYTARIDKTKPTMGTISITDRFSSTPKLSATCTDSDSGPSSFNATVSCSGGNCTVSCTDNAGNTQSTNKTYTKSRDSVCGTEQYQSGSNCACNTYTCACSTNTCNGSCKTWGYNCPNGGSYSSSRGICVANNASSYNCYSGKCSCYSASYQYTVTNATAYTNCVEYCANNGLGSFIGGALTRYTCYRCPSGWSNYNGVRDPECYRSANSYCAEYYKVNCNNCRCYNCPCYSTRNKECWH